MESILAMSPGFGTKKQAPQQLDRVSCHEKLTFLEPPAAPEMAETTVHAEQPNKSRMEFTLTQRFSGLL